jgi:hypothetical protein
MDAYDEPQAAKYEQPALKIRLIKKKKISLSIPNIISL